MALLLTALGEQARARDDYDGPIRATQATKVHTAPSPKSKSPASNWTDKNVQDWLKKEKLDDLCDKLDGLDGSHLEEMYLEYSSDANKFKDEIRSDYQMNGKVGPKFTVALKTLFQK
ncbi:uncharacterized protein [Amphiura filiformis]|uniref:uncharacterized protein isoform X2 n=1 Tax=Amphiura filiformis TaxID=82378 RepID=UPI003B2146B8